RRWPWSGSWPCPSFSSTSPGSKSTSPRPVRWRRADELPHEPGRAGSARHRPDGRTVSRYQRCGASRVDLQSPPSSGGKSRHAPTIVGQCGGAPPETDAMNEAETCRKLVRPKLEAAGWDNAPHSINEQVSFTDGRIIVAGSKAVRREQK